MMVKSTAKRPKLWDETPSLPVLPEELIWEILLRLPVRSLLQFKSVCKSWKTLISDPQFAKDHIRTSTTNPNMAHLQLVSSSVGPRTIKSYSVHSLFQNPSAPAKRDRFRKMSCKHEVLGSCNGLLCLLDIRQRYVTLWNPSTRTKSKRFPTGVGVDQVIIYHGFGYDHVNNKYKLLVALDDPRETVTKVYTFGAKSWTVVQTFPGRPYRRLGKFVSGTLNWIAKRGGQWVILSFDLGTETCAQVLMPDGDCDNVFNPVLDVSRNCLSLCFFDNEEAHWVVWLMKEYGVQHSWAKLMMIPPFVKGDWTWNKLIMIPHDQLWVCRWCQSLGPLYISENGLVLFQTRFSKFVVYNSNDGSLGYHGTKNNLWMDVQSYHESLVSPQC